VGIRRDIALRPFESNRLLTGSVRSKANSAARGNAIAGRSDTGVSFRTAQDFPRTIAERLGADNVIGL